MPSGTLKTFQFLGLTFDWTTIISTSTAFVIVLALGIFLSRRLSIRPGKRQNLLEWIIDFTNGIVKNQLPDRSGSTYRLYIFALFLFVFVSNQLGLFLEFGNDSMQVRSPTSIPLITLTLALMSLMVAHFAGVMKFGFVGYLKNTFLAPTAALFPVKIIDQITNLLTLGLRIYGNIFAGEILLNLIAGFALPNNTFNSPVSFILSIPLELVWQAFSLLIGAIQAFVFATLTSVYISQMITKE
ncbi:F0F1 ATP synthase subunit A [Oenococcus kitaharae]|uniref:ATP synthase subunit a n=1 Tax=Oenococcus kitaharae DSM 17330 TaxID=1045004 RepID=G9WGL3_9LACO|nr:F0F1 ATP synthase subunit A [Oenococcus kitaharae]EHN59840.1 ATP synthase A chain [Oenococcus kitaharae DSM 17330]OEY83653.1 ATP synthase subunit A [Oenococcus kitaharae]OEY85450.1 ATP synthase subunit A [Oenococcus kitaharae]OEY86303.1 ATP synthase subunit A [Oenococcus kitaharae]